MRLRAIVLLLLFVSAAPLAAEESRRPEGPGKVWVHAPAEDLLALFPEAGGFLISAAEYEKLVALARENEKRRTERPPLAGRLVRGAAEARVEGDVLRLTASYVAVVHERKATVPFPLEKIALESIAVEGGELVGSELRFREPGTYAVTASLAARLETEGERRSASFRLPPAAAHTVSLALPPQVEGEVGPIVRAFESGPEGGRVVGYPDEHGVFSVWVAPRSPARELDPLLSATFGVRAEVGEARTLVRSALRVEILRAPVDRFRLGLAKGETIRGLTGKGVKSWRVVRGDGDEGDHLDVRLVERTQGRLDLGIESEIPRDEFARAVVTVPRLENAVRFVGRIAVAARPEVRITGLDATGARRQDFGRKQRGRALFEAWSPDARIALDLERVAARTRAELAALLGFREGGKSLHVRVAYHIAGRPVFRLEPSVPAGWIVRQVRLDGREQAYRYEPDGRVVLDFPHGLKPGTHRLDLRVETDEVDWVPGAGEPVEFELAGVRSGLEDEHGALYVTSDRAFRVTAEETRGLEKAPVARGAGDRLLYAWRSTTPGFAVRFVLRRHRPVVRATVVTHLFPSDRLLRVLAVADVEIKRTGVRELKVALPAGTGPLVEFQGPYIKERRAPEEGADPETWTLVFQKRVRGEYRLAVSFDRSFEADAWTATAPDIALPDAQDRGFLVVHPAETAELSVDRGGLREADVGELPRRPKRTPLEVLSWSEHPYTVRISSRKHESEPVVQAIALSAHVYGVVTPDGLLRCRAEYRVRNNDQAFLSCRLPRGATLLGVTVDGKPEKPLLEDGALRLPLPRSKDRETPFPVAVVYESRVAALEETGRLAIGRPALDIDVLKTRYSLHLPRGYTVTDHDGDLVPLSAPQRRTVLGTIAAILPPWSGGAVGADAPASFEPAEPEEEVTPRNARHGTRGRKADRKAKAKAPKKAPGRAEERARRRLAESEKRVAEGTVEADETLDRNESDKDAEFEESAGDDGGTSDAPFSGPAGGTAPGERRPTDPEPPPPPSGSPAEEPALGIGGGAGGGHAGRAGFVAEDPGGGPSAGDGSAGRAPSERRRARPERALLSLDIHPLRPDNLVRLDSLAPTGGVELHYRHATADDRAHYLGLVLGGLAGLFALVLGVKKRRLLPAILVGFFALHFAGRSFLPSEFAVGAAQALLGVFALGLVVALVPRRRPRWLRSRIAGALLAACALAGTAGAQDGDAPGSGEVLVPYGDDPHAVERVFLPSEEYHRLRRLAYPETAGRATALRSARYVAVRRGGELTVEARYEIVKETEAAERVPLALDGAAVSEARLGDRPATLEVRDGGYVLVLEKKGRFELHLTLRPRLEDGSFSVPVRPVADATLVVEHDRPDHEVRALALGGRGEDAWRLGPVGLLQASWRPKTRAFRAAEAELRAQTETVVAVRDGFTGVATRVRYGIAGGKTDRFRFRLAPDLTVRRIACTGLAGWQVEGDTLVVALREPAERERTVTVHAERAAATRARTEAYPGVAPLDVVRDAGVVALETIPALELEITSSRGLLRGTKDQAPADLRAAPDRGELHSVRRYAVRPFELEWRVYEEPVRLRAAVDVDVLLDRRETRATVNVRVDRERGPGPFTLALTLPGGYDVVSVQGRHADWWERDGVVHVDLGRRLQDRATLRLHLRRRGATDEGVAAPSVVVRGAARQRGRVRVAVADGLDLEVVEESGLLPRDAARAGTIPGWTVRRLYEYVAAPWRLVARTSEEPHELEALAVSRVVPLAGRVRVEALVNFHVRRGLVDEVSFFVPVADEAAVLVNAPDLREERSEEVGDGRRYTLLLRRPTRDATAVTVVYHVPEGRPIRGVEPAGVARTHRYVAVEKIPDGEVRVTRAERLDPGGFEDLPLVPEGVTARSVAAVYLGAAGPFSMDIAVNRHEFEEVAKAVIYRAAARTVLERSGWVRVAVQYRVYNRSEQFLRLELPDGAELYSALVAGEGVRPLGEDGALLVPLKKVALGAPTFDVDVVYAYQGRPLEEAAFDVRLPRVLDLEVERTTLSLHVPRGLSADFETDMREVGAEEIAAGEAGDVYREVKELAQVVELGSELQSERALRNIRRVQQEANRLLEDAERMAREEETRKKVASQKRALDALTKNLENKQRDAAGRRDAGQRPAQKPQTWTANDAYLEGATEEGRRQVKAFKQAQERQQAEEKQARGKGARTDAEELKKVADELVEDSAVVNSRFRDDPRFRAGLTFGIDDAARADIDSRGPGVTAGAFRQDFAPGTARGRISLRIDLPLEGDVHHFARLGGEGAVTVRASRADGRVLEGVLAAVCIAVASLILFFRRPA